MNLNERIGAIQLEYRAAKAMEALRIGIEQRLAAYARVHLTGWDPTADEAARKRHKDQAKRVINALLSAEPAEEGDAEIAAYMHQQVADVMGAWTIVENLRATHRKRAEAHAKELPGWPLPKPQKGFGIWGLCALYGEAGDIGTYHRKDSTELSVRALYKRLGLAPDESYEKGERKKGRKIPRATRGRVMGIIADPLLRAQWRGDENGGHPIGDMGAVYGEVKQRALARELPKGHAHSLGRRAMVKALVHEVWSARVGVKAGEEAKKEVKASNFLSAKAEPPPPPV